MHFHEKGFEIIDVLNHHCHPDSVTNAFTTLMSLFNDVQGDSEPIVKFWSRFDGMIMDLSCCKDVIPPLLLVMIFIRALHLRYSDILDQFGIRLLCSAGKLFCYLFCEFCLFLPVRLHERII